MRLEELKPGSFIYQAPGALEPDFCDAVIRRFEDNPEQQYPGRLGPEESREESIKRSTDLRISGRDEWRDVDAALLKSLQSALMALSAEHPFFAHNQFKDLGYNLQRSRPGEFYHWHVDSGPGVFSQRQLVAIWYLNAVPPGGGETEFYFQQVKVVPECGKLILFPPFWTHLHRGTVVETGVKYIATTWVCFG